MNLPPFTLIHDPRVRKPGQRKRLIEERLQGLEPELSDSLRSVKPALKSAVLRSVDTLTPGVEVLRKVVRELERHPHVIVAGLWDLSSQVGELPRIIECLNEAQPMIAFFEVQASVAAGLVSRPERIVRRLLEGGHKPPSKRARKEMADNVFFEDFAISAERVREDLGIDYLIGITPYMVAFEDSGEAYWNYFSCFAGEIVLASTYGVYEYASKARRPFEAAVAGIAVSALLAAMNPRLEYHEEIRGCFFDFNEERDTIVKALKAGYIDEDCLKRIKPRYREAALALVAALRSYRGTSGGNR